MAVLSSAAEIEPRIREVGTELAERLPKPRALSVEAMRQRMMRLLSEDDELRAALFRFVDVRPALDKAGDVTRHLAELLEEAENSPIAQRSSRIVGARALSPATSLIGTAGVRQMAHNFIAGEDPKDATGEFARLWERGVACTVDLLGEATVTEAEADRYFDRCEDGLRVLSEESAGWAEQPLLEHDGIETLARANLSVKPSGLTPLLRANAPARGADGATDRLRRLLRLARDREAHLHMDMESYDTVESSLELLLGLLAEAEFAEGPSTGIVLQGYLAESERILERLLAWASEHPRGHRLTIRLVKGAYWDHEVAQAAQSGWSAPVFTEKRATDRQFEALTRTLLDNTALIRPAIGSHNLRSLAHAIAYAEAIGLERETLELQVLRGLGDDVQVAIAEMGLRVRAYCPVGDLVSGMAYLVRRLLENTSNESFLTAQAAGTEIDQLLEAP